MNRSSMSILAKILAEKNSMTISEAEAFIKQMFDVANGVMQADKQLKIRWLGTFKVTSVKDRESVDVNTGERIVIGGRDKITFTPDNILKEIVNKPFAQFETVVVNDGVDFSEIDRKFSFESKEDVSIPSDEQQPSDELENSPIEKLESIPVVTTVQSAEPVVQENETPTEEVPVHVEDLNVLPEEKVWTEEHESVLPVEEKQLEKPISEVQEAEQSVKEEEPEQVVETSSVQEETSESTPEVTDLVSQPKQTTPAAESYFEDKDADNADEVDEVDDVLVSDKKHYFMLPRYVISVAVVLIIVLIGGVGWFAFNYGKMQAQRNHLAMQLEEMQKTRLKKDSLARLQKDDLRMKALQDSARLAQAAEVVNSVDEHQTEAQVDSIKKAEAKAKVQEVAKIAAEKRQVEAAKEKEAAKMKEKALTESKYDADPRVRTGAYRITGIEQTVVAKSGQTLSSISKLYLGPGMECYLEAVNGGAIDVKAGQKIKIPKLVLKKKK
nr:HU family DNA-binding protein [uncultured Prevotella sp.]